MNGTEYQRVQRERGCPLQQTAGAVFFLGPIQATITVTSTTPCSLTTETFLRWGNQSSRNFSSVPLLLFLPGIGPVVQSEEVCPDPLLPSLPCHLKNIFLSLLSVRFLLCLPVSTSINSSRIVPAFRFHPFLTVLSTKNRSKRLFVTRIKEPAVAVLPACRKLPCWQ